LRWDIDHLYGLEKGVPRIISVCNEFNVKCSFYINLGKSFDFREWMFKSLKKSYIKLKDPVSINIIQKLGYFRSLQLIALNPKVGLSRIDLLRQIIVEGHELGLHGALNHMLWSRRLDDFSINEVDQMLEQAVFIFKKELGINIIGFAAPGFRWSRASLTCLDRIGFAYSGDQWGDKPFYPRLNGTTFKHMCLPVTLIGPNTVPIIEYHAALGKDNDEIAAIVCREIGKKDFAVLYGHPVFEGLKVDILRKIFNFALENGYKVLKHEEIYERYKDKSPEIDVLPQMGSTRKDL
jgi:peptidoglycan/xylan/chitin deacetylase (PgdA/CDA1 family)